MRRDSRWKDGMICLDKVFIGRVIIIVNDVLFV